MGFFLPQNPGIGGIDELTTTEETFVQNLSGLSYAQGDILYYDGSNLTRLAAGTSGWFLKTQGAGANPVWAAGSGTVDGSGTTNELVYWVDSDTLGALAVATYPSLTELTYVKGVTSAIQTQIGLKANLASPTFTGTVTIPTPFTLGAVSVTATGTELNYVAGVTSAIQTQLDTKATLAGAAATIKDGGANEVDAAELGAGASTDGQVLTSDGAGGAAWEAVAGGGDMVLADIQTVTGAKTFGSAGAVGKLKIAGTTSGALTVDTSAVAGTATITIPAVTDTLIGKATTDTLTNKTFDADGTGNSITNIENADIKVAAAIAVNKLAALTASEIVITDASGFITSAAVATYPSLTELTYVRGVTSAIQTQLGTKVTSGGALGTPSSGTGTNITGIPAASILAGSLGTGAYVIDSSLQAATIELGHATDTTLSRVSAGVVSIEGNNIITANIASSLTVAGVVELATTAEIDTGTDSTRAIPIDQLVASKRNIRWLVFNLVEAATDVAVATNIGGDFVSPIAGTILQSDTTPFYIYATNSTAGTTGTQVVDVNINGTTIMTTNKLDTDSTEKTTTTAVTPPDLTTTALAVGDIITIDVDAVHTTAGKGLTVFLAIRET